MVYLGYIGVEQLEIAAIEVSSQRNGNDVADGDRLALGKPCVLLWRSLFEESQGSVRSLEAHSPIVATSAQSWSSVEVHERLDLEQVGNFLVRLQFLVCSTRFRYMLTQRRLFIGVAFLLALPIVAFFAIPVLLGLESEGPPRLVVGDRADESITAVLERGLDEPSEVVAEQVEVAVVAEIETIEGRWLIAGDSVAGYRVFKDFVGASEFEAVGRTSSVFGGLTIEGTSVTQADFNVDIASVTSDDDRRDQQFRGPILNASIFPFATFNLVSEIDLGGVPSNGEEVNVDVLGELTLRGQTREVEFPLTARLIGDEVQVAGSIDVVFADFGIDPPFTPTIVVRDEGIIEFSLFFEQGDAA